MSNKKSEPRLANARIQNSLLSRWEKPALRWLVRQIPPWIGPDHLTLLGLFSTLGAGLFYAAGDGQSGWLHLASFCIAVNWLGDSLDGTLARFRCCQRPRYGFYVDHMIDTFGMLFLVGGLILSPLLSWSVGLVLLVVYFMLAINSYLAAHTLGVFQLSFARFSPTELRLLLIGGNSVAAFKPLVTLFGLKMLLFDVGALVAITAMLLVLVVSAFHNTIQLYRLERPKP